MTIDYAIAAKNSLSNHVDDLVNAGVGSYGKLVFLTSLGVPVATLPLSVPAFGDAVQGTIVANALVADTSAAGGLIARFALLDKDGTAVLNGSVGTAGADINLERIDIPAGSTVALNTLTYSTP